MEISLNKCLVWCLWSRANGKRLCDLLYSISVDKGQFILVNWVHVKGFMDVLIMAKFALQSDTPYHRSFTGIDNIGQGRPGRASVGVGVCRQTRIRLVDEHFISINDPTDCVWAFWVQILWELVWLESVWASAAPPS